MHAPTATYAVRKPGRRRTGQVRDLALAGFDPARIAALHLPESSRLAVGAGEYELASWCAMDTDGSVRCTEAPQETSEPVPGVANLQALTTGPWHEGPGPAMTCGIVRADRKRRVACWHRDRDMYGDVRWLLPHIEDAA